MQNAQFNIHALFDGTNVRRARLGRRWLYSVVDLIRALSDQPDAQEYWEDLKRWEPHLASACKVVKVPEAHGRWVGLEMVDLEHALRLIQSIQSPAAEEAKTWLAQAGRQHLEELANPELAIRRTRRIYEQRGYTPEWIDKRLAGINARHELTREWYRRGAKESDDFRSLTNEITSSAFGMDVAAYRRYKGLSGGSLRDHMNELELILTVLGETTTSLLHKQRDSHGLDQLTRDAHDAGEVAGRTRQQLEDCLGQTLVSHDNNLKVQVGGRAE